MGDSYYYNDGGSTAALAAVLLVLIPVLFILALAAYVISSFLYMKIFEKAGVQGKWRAWVPVYNGLIAAKLGDVSPWVVLVAVVASSVLSNIPVIGPVFSLVILAVAVMYSYRIGLKLGKDWPLLLLWLIPGVGALIWLAIIAFSNNRWNPAIPPAPWANSFLADKTVWNGIPVQPSQPVAGNGGGYAGSGYGAPPAQPYSPPQTPPAAGTTPPPAPGTTPPPPAPPAGPQV
ncbi:large exoprotein [uncultured Microbacterium sp.]|uniref:large exoprotein n=1 Tax=uncultured Microbacterium sp. TaxID=191216 RepID=UPI0025DF1D58|nr:large exoprotein [uncultured Microbacterium sp.]